MKKLLALFTSLAIVLIALFGFSGVKAFAANTVVTSADPQGWSSVVPYGDTRTGGAVNYIADATSPLPSGALQLTTDATNAAKANYGHAADTLLSAITELSYSTKQVSGPAVADPSYQVAVLLDGTAGSYTNLVYEPYWNGTVTPGVWQSWDVDAGRFWSSRSFTTGGCSVTSGAGGPPFYTLAALQVACPTAVVVGFGVNVGTYNPSYDVETDAVDFNGTTYDFELAPVLVPSVTTNSATNETLTTATLNGTNGPVAADNTSFWWGTTPMTYTLTPGSNATIFPLLIDWNHDNGLGSTPAGGAFSNTLTGLTPGQTYYFVAWVEVDGIWYPGNVLSFVEPVEAAVCPAGTTKSSQPLTSVTVNSNSSTPTVSSSLTSGSYILSASGTWTNGGLNVADASFASLNSWTTYQEGYDIGQYLLGPNEFNLDVDGAFTNWSPYDGSSHTYSNLYTSTGGAANFLVFDGNSNNGPTAIESGWYGDNSGNLSVDIYPCMPNVKYVTGGGNIKTSKAVTWTFGGNVWTNDGGSLVGNFELSDKVSKVNYHFNQFTLVSSTPNSITFLASGTIQGKTNTPVNGVTFTITDNGEPGNNDTISVTGGTPNFSIPSTLISGGNFQVLVQ